MPGVVLVGRRADHGRRDLLWAHCRARWERELGWPVVEGHHDGEGPFCMSVAANRAAAAAGAWTVAAFVGADTLPGHVRQVQAAVTVAGETGLLVFPHDRYQALSEKGTDQVLSGLPLAEAEPEWEPWPNTFSSLLVIPRKVWDAVGGFDERFVGYGWEDLAFWAACCAVAGGYDRVPGTVYHLWHERVAAERDEAPEWPANEALGRRYLAAKASRDLMLEILAERHAP